MTPYLRYAVSNILFVKLDHRRGKNHDRTFHYQSIVKGVVML
jgi:hypothetical protein